MKMAKEGGEREGGWGSVDVAGRNLLLLPFPGGVVEDMGGGPEPSVAQ